MRNKKVLIFGLDILRLVSVMIGISCVFTQTRIFFLNHHNFFNIFLIKSVFFRGNFKISKIFKNNKSDKINNIINNNMLNSDNKINFPEVLNSQENNNYDCNEKTYKIIEKNINSGGIKCKNFYIKNNTDLDINFDEYFNKNPDIRIKNTGDPQVLIVHTHTSESYMSEDRDFFYESYYPRSLEDSKNVTQVGKVISETLIKNGINCIHNMTYHDNPSYSGSYSRAAKTIQKCLEEYPSIQVVLDIHRDSLGTKETGKIKPVFNFQNKKSSQIMIISGCDPDGSLGFPNWQKNLILALKLQNYCENMFPGITRPLNFSKVKYNENLTPGSLLIEIGSEVNTLQESVNTGVLLGEALSELLNNLKNN